MPDVPMLQDGAAQASGPAPARLTEGAFLAAHEVLILLGAPLPAEVEAWLERRLLAKGRVVVLCAAWRDPDYLRRLLTHGCLVYDTARDDEQVLVFLDEHQGWVLPAGEALTRPFETACALLWERIGSYTLLQGRVDAVYSDQHAFQLAEQPRVWLIAPHRRMLPEAGAVVSVLGRSFWAGSSGLAVVFEVIAWWPQAIGGASTEGNAGEAARSSPGRRPSGAIKAPSTSTPGSPACSHADRAAPDAEPPGRLLPDRATLRAAFQYADCPICGCVADTLERFWQQLADAAVLAAVERQLEVGGPLCHRHGWMAYRRLPAAALQRLLLAAVRSHRPRVAALAEAAAQPQTTLAARRALRQAHAALTAAGSCLACMVEREASTRALHLLIEALARPDTQEAYCQSEGLCVRHAREALARAPRPVARLLVARLAAQFEALLQDIALYYHKATWEFAHEPKGAEQQAWRRGIARWAGPRRAVPGGQ